ncbi:MAG: MFS transporter [Elusimicrobia bacterium]|jgi:MFS family permease|nr:MFS transporter [Elusimicrobiota bacterium]
MKPLPLPSRTSFLLRALRYPNYRLFFGGQIISLVGTWIGSTAISWLVYRLTGSGLALGVVGFVGQFPAFIITPFAGLVVDRWDRRKLLITTQTLSMVQSFALAFVVLTDRATLPALLVLAGLQGVVNAFDMPGRQALVVDLIEKKEDLGNAIALNSSLFNLARLVGPSLGGLLIVAVGEGVCFLADGVSYLAVIGALLAMRVRPRVIAPPQTQGTLNQLWEGWRYTFKSPTIRPILILLALSSLMGAPYMTLVPLFAGNVLGGGPHTLGFLMTAAGVGALAGALTLAGQKPDEKLRNWIPRGAGLFAVGLIAFSFSKTLWLSMGLLVVCGFGFMIQMATSNTLIQTTVDDDKRGRVMSLFIMAFLGVAPFGALIAGSLTEKIGAPHTLLVGGICVLAGTFWLNRKGKNGTGKDSNLRRA